MTTLPQTIPVRLPAVMPGAAANGTPLAVPMHAAAAAGNQMTGADVWRVIRSHLWLIVALVVVFGVGGVLLNKWLGGGPQISPRLNGMLFRATGMNANRWLAESFPRYQARGILEIEMNMLKDPIKDVYTTLTRENLQIEKSKHATALRSEALLTKVLQNPDSPIRKTSWMALYRTVAPTGEERIDYKTAKEYLSENFKVNPTQESPHLLVDFGFSRPDDCKVIVEAIVDTYLREKGEEATLRQTEQVQALKMLESEISRSLSSLSDELQQAQMRLSANGGGTPDKPGTKEMLLRAQYDEMFRLANKAAEARFEYERVQDQVNQGQVPTRVQKEVEEDPMLVSLTREIFSSEMRRDILLQSLPPEAPAVKNIDNMIGLAQRKMDGRRAELQVNYKNQYLGELKQKADQFTTQYKTLAAEVEKLTGDLAGINREQTILSNRKRTELEQRERVISLGQKLDDMRAFGLAASRPPIRWEPNGKPIVPEVRTRPLMMATVSLAVMLGLSLALGIAFLRFYMDDTVRSPRDIARVGQFNLLGIIPDDADDPQAAGTALPIFDAPHSHTAEQFRQVRTRLSHAAALDTTRSIMVTGPSPMDGKTTVASNLAAGLALNGRKILLVDSNFRRPELHRMFSLAGNERGFSDVLNGTVAFDEVVQSTKVPNLSVMTSGPKPMNPTELFESQLLIDFIERALEEYDHVIFDSGPLLIVSEAVALAARVDGVVTVVRAHSESRGLLHRMRDTLRQVKAEHIGVVLNAVRSHGGGYYGRNIKQFYQYQQDTEG